MKIDRNTTQGVAHDPSEPTTLGPQAQKPKPATPNAPRGESALTAAYQSTQRTLERDPSQADRLIGERLRGCSATDREIVMRAVAQRGNTGLRKYADAEQVLRSLRPFDKDQRTDILASMKVGTRFSAAVADEQASLKVPVEYESKSGASAVAELQSKAIANSRAQAAKVSELSRHVMALNREVGKLNRGAEAIAGAGSAVGLVGGTVVGAAESVVRGKTAPMKEVLHRAETAGDLMAGELSDKIARADITTQKFLKLSGTYTDARNHYERAVRGNDFQAMTRYSKEMGAAAKEMGRLATSLAEQAKTIAKLNKGMDHAVVETAATVLLAAVSLGSGHAPHGVAQVAKHIAEDGLAERLLVEVHDQVSGH